MAIPALPAHGASWDSWAAGLDSAARVAVLKWQPSTAYTAGDVVINPSGQTVTANATFTSGASYSASNWTVVAGGGGTVVDATTTAKGVVQLAGDLAGTAAAPTVPGLAAKAPLASPTFTGTVSGVTKAMVGLGSVDNTADTAKPVSTAQQSAIDTASTADRARANHTGTQAASTITGLATVATSGAYTDLSAKPTIPTVGAAGAGAGVALSSTDASVTNARTPTAHTHPASDLTATGTPSATTFLRGDNTWAAPAGGGGGGVFPAVRGALPTTSIPGAFAETFARWAPSVTGSAGTSGTPRLVAITLYAGEVISKVGFSNGGTPIAGGTHQWAALTDASGVVLAVSPDDTSGAWAGNAAKSFTFTSPYTVTTTGTYYIALCLVATTMPNSMVITTGGAASALLPAMGATAPSNTGSPPTVSSSIGTLTFAAAVLYAAIG